MKVFPKTIREWVCGLQWQNPIAWEDRDLNTREWVCVLMGASFGMMSGGLIAVIVILVSR